MATIESVAQKVAMGPFGSSIKVETFVPEGVPIISGQHLRSFRLDERPGFNYITIDHANRLRNACVQRGDVVFTHAGNIGQVAYIPEDSQYDRYVISQRQFYMRCDPERVIPQYVVYFFSTPEGRHLLLANMAQVGVPSLAQPVSYLRGLEIPVPPLNEQRAIACILGALDDKIELNRKMNRTLEGIARAVFKSWFVDFDPVRAKAEGRDPGLPSEIADLFPSSFVDSELGPIPEGWGVRPVGDLVHVLGGGTPSTKMPQYWLDGNHPFCTPKDMAALSSPVLLDTERCLTDEGLLKVSSGQLPAGTVLLSSRAPIGYLAIAETPISVNQGIIAMVCDSRLPNLYVYQWTSANMERIISNANGSTFLEISKANFRPIKAIMPSPHLIRAFMRVAKPLHEHLVSITRENRSLASLRDTLLPKLISGELRVPDAERIVGRCVQ